MKVNGTGTIKENTEAKRTKKAKEDAGCNEIKNIVPIILAGGLGTRMRSDLPKALSGLLENPMLFYSVAALLNAAAAVNSGGGECRTALNKIGIVIGHKGELVKNYVLEEDRFKNRGVSFDFAGQEKYLGTGDAVLKALDMLTSYGDETELLLLPCDMPLIKAQTFNDALSFHLNNKNDLTVLSFLTDNPYSFGRILKDKNGYVKEIIEENELGCHPESVGKINEVNSGVYVVKLGHIRRLIKLIKPDNTKKEYYFTDIAKIFFKDGLRVVSFSSKKQNEFAGVNSKADLFNAQSLIQERVIRGLMQNGVTFLSTGNVYIGYNAKIGEGATIYPGVFISGHTEIHKGVTVEVGSIIKDSVIYENAAIKSYSVLENASVGRSAQIGPFARIRPESTILEGAKIGNFVEIKKSVIGKNTKASHLSYIGDATVGGDVNIGAGVITCNYDGAKKHTTVIEDGCFIGSDSQLIAPIKIGKNSYIGSGTTLTRDVPEGSLALSRTPQVNKSGWALKRLKKIKHKD